MIGRLSEGVLPDLLKSIYVGRRTGFLKFVRGVERCHIGFVKGHIAYGASSFKDHHMGEVMVAHGRLTEKDLRRASEVVIRERRRLGQVLVDLGVMDENGIEEALALHAREVLLEIFSWNDGGYSFEAQPPEVFHGHDRPLRLSTGEVILDAVWSIKDRDVVRYALGDLDRVLLPSTDPLLRFQRITLTPTDGFILSRIDGTLSAREILAIAPASPEEGERCLLGLLCTGMAEYAPPRPRSRGAEPDSIRDEILELYGSLANRDHFQVLGVEPSSTAGEIKAAYFRLVKRYHPDTRHDRALSDLGDKLEAIFQRINEAFHAVADAVEPRRGPAGVDAPVTAGPAEAAPSLPSLTAEDLVLKARERLDDGKHWEAVALLGEAIPLATGALRSRAGVLLAKAYLRTPDRVKEAEKELRSVLEADGQCADAALLLGHLYRDAGLPARAAALYQKVLETKPNHAEARGALDAIASPEDGKPGVLRKLFGRT